MTSGTVLRGHPAAAGALYRQMEITFWLERAEAQRQPLG
jgi:hypothetical protein